MSLRHQRPGHKRKSFDGLLGDEQPCSELPARFAEGVQGLHHAATRGLPTPIPLLARWPWQPNAGREQDIRLQPTGLASVGSENTPQGKLARGKSEPSGTGTNESPAWAIATRADQSALAMAGPQELAHTG